MFQGGYSLSSAAGHKGPLEKPQDEKRPEFKPIPGFKELLNIPIFLLFFFGWTLAELSCHFLSNSNTFFKVKRKKPMLIPYMDVSENSGFSPQIIHFNRVFHYKPSVLGYPYFGKHPYNGIKIAKHFPLVQPPALPPRTVALEGGDGLKGPPRRSARTRPRVTWRRWWWESTPWDGWHPLRSNPIYTPYIVGIY